MATKARTKKAVPASEPVEFKHDALAIRTVNASDAAYGGFQWPAEINALVECPDWNSRAQCGNGFHALLDGIGDWSLTWRDDGMIWQVVGVRRDECVAVGDDKVKFPRCRLLYRGDKAGALKLILPAMVGAIMKGADGKIATGYSGHAAATGDRGHAAATGDRGHAAATGYSGHAAATGDSGHAAATGDRGHAAATGDRGHAAATGYSGHAAVSGKSSVAASLGIEGTAQAVAGSAISLACYDPKTYALVCVRAAMVGADGVEAGKTYRLNAKGEFVEVQP